MSVADIEVMADPLDSQVDEVIKQAEALLRLTAERDLFSASEMQDFLLDVRTVLVGIRERQ